VSQAQYQSFFCSFVIYHHHGWQGFALDGGAFDGDWLSSGFILGY
jgi:hypothetical protein